MTGQKQKNNTAVLVFLKYPIPGQVKTRLANTMGDEKACEIYLELLHRVFALTQCLSREAFTVYAVYDSAHPVGNYQSLLSNYRVNFIPQTNGDLGERLFHAFFNVLEFHESAIAIGTDCVSLTKEIFETARQLLHDQKNCVIGPSEDGGYYLIGLSKAYPELFEKISWSTSTVFKETLQKSHELSLQVQILAKLYDIDTPSDYQNYLLKQFAENSKD